MISAVIKAPLQRLLLPSLIRDSLSRIPVTQRQPYRNRKHLVTRLRNPRSVEMAHSHSHDNGTSHSHAGAAVDHGHTHEVLDGPGSFLGREPPLIQDRDWRERAFTVGIGG